MGETYQREMETGEKLYCEQISHRPNLTAYQLEDPDGDYEYNGHFEIKAWLNGPNSLAGSKEGKLNLSLKDGTKYTIKDPLLIINNLISGGMHN
mmetsp:Transcript_10368/g.15959  ORF Transcript_10368/g.15959 Transcript_10368/m.15959 type:complete len:94 (+) Transcript_10368:474-755(+)